MLIFLRLCEVKDTVWKYWYSNLRAYYFSQILRLTYVPENTANHLKKEFTHKETLYILNVFLTTKSADQESKRQLIN